MEFSQGVTTFLVVIGSLLVYGFGIITLLWWSFDGKIEFVTGIVGILGSIGMMTVTILGGGGFISGFLLVVYVSLILTYSFAERKLIETELRGLNTDLLDRSYAELNRRPDNVPAAFQLARCLYNIGMRGHGIALSEQTLDRLSTDQDPTANRSIRDLYRAEEYELKKWKEQSQDPRFFRPITCPKCKFPNPPGHLACQRCQSPYLLEIARTFDPRGKVISKLILSWGIITIVMPLAALLGLYLSGMWLLIGVLLGLALAGGVLYWTFRLSHGETGDVRTSA